MKIGKSHLIVCKFFFALSILCLIFPGNLFSQGIEESLEFEGIHRTFISYTPTFHGKNLLLLFHGHGGNAANMLYGYGFIGAADKTRTVVVSVDGVESDGSTWPAGTRSWNADNCCGASWELGVNDVGFVSVLIDYLKWKYRVENIYLLGFSNGGMLCHRIAREIPGISGIADISGHGGMYVAPVQPLQIIMVHGMLDPVVPFNEDTAPNGDDRYDIPFERMVEFYNRVFGFLPARIRRMPISTCKIATYKNGDFGLLSIVFPEGGHECLAWSFVLDSIFRFFKLEVGRWE